jgi:hypothetical protein
MTWFRHNIFSSKLIIWFGLILLILVMGSYWCSMCLPGLVNGWTDPSWREISNYKLNNLLNNQNINNKN